MSLHEGDEEMPPLHSSGVTAISRGTRSVRPHAEGLDAAPDDLAVAGEDVAGDLVAVPVAQ